MTRKPGGDPPHGADPEAARPPRLSLGDPLRQRASEDRPESWGERNDFGRGENRLANGKQQDETEGEQS